MEIIFIIIIAIILIVKDKKTDLYCKNKAIKNGYDMYASSTGLRYTKNDKLVYDVKDIGRK